jgi:succinoglycan biosynthesis protein ExoM
MDKVDVITVTIAIITYKRPESFPYALQALQKIELPDGAAVKLLVIDNDAAQSAFQVVQDAARYMPFPVEYVVEEKHGIPHARNKALEVASDSDYIAFVDDDDTVDPHWLHALLDTARIYDADAVKGEVIYTFDKEHQYLAHLAIFAATGKLTGQELVNASTNNVLFATHIYKNTGLRFDPSFTKTGGSDHYFFRVAKGNGAHIVFSADGIVYSNVSGPRTTWRWISRRYMRYGANITVSRIKHTGYLNALGRTGYELVDSGGYLLRITRWALVGRQPVIHPLMITCYMIGCVMGLFYLSPHEYK